MRNLHNLLCRLWRARLRITTRALLTRARGRTRTIMTIISTWRRLTIPRGSGVTLWRTLILWRTTKRKMRRGRERWRRFSTIRIWWKRTIWSRITWTTRRLRLRTRTRLMVLTIKLSRRVLIRLYLTSFFN